jgi:hypothetical protein
MNSEPKINSKNIGTEAIKKAMAKNTVNIIKNSNLLEPLIFISHYPVASIVDLF